MVAEHGRRRIEAPSASREVMDQPGQRSGEVLTSSSGSPPRSFAYAGSLLVVFLAAVAAIHSWVVVHQPPPQLWGDEPQYLEFAEEDALLGHRNPLPGFLRFDHQPQLFSRVLSWLRSSGIQHDAFYRRISTLQIFLFVGVLAAVYGQCRFLALSRAGALFAVVLLGLFPWFAFHVHSLWPEVLHALLLGSALLALFTHFRRRSRISLVLSGLLSGLALLTKSVLQPFIPLFVLFAAWASYADDRTQPRVIRLRSAALSALAFTSSLLLVVAPQLVRNWKDGHGLRLAANRWWNLELGLTLPAPTHVSSQPDDPQEDPWVEEQRSTARYFQTGKTPARREAKARERTLSFLEGESAWSLCVAQTQKLVSLVLHGESCLEQSLTPYRPRWGTDPPRWITALRVPGRALWYAILVLGILGASCTLWRIARGREGGLGWRFLLAFTTLYWLILLLVPVKIRFLLPTVPLLCIFAGALVDRTWAALHGLRGDATPTR